MGLPAGQRRGDELKAAAHQVPGIDKAHQIAEVQGGHLVAVELGAWPQEHPIMAPFIRNDAFQDLTLLTLPSMVNSSCKCTTWCLPEHFMG